MGGGAEGGDEDRGVLGVGEVHQQRADADGREEGYHIEVFEAELLEVARHAAVHRRFGVFEFGFVEQLGVFCLFFVGAGEEEFFVAVFGHHVDEVGKVLIAKEYLAFAILYVVLQIECNGFGGAEVFHTFGDDFAQFFGHPKEVVDRVFAVENDSAVFCDVDSAFAEFGCGNTHNFKEFVEGEIQFEVENQSFVGRFFEVGWFGLRNEYFFYFHTKTVQALQLYVF